MLKGWDAAKVPLLERFWLYVLKTDGCWPWLGSKTTWGYGRIKSKGKTIKASHLSWEIHNGPKPPLLCVLHKCDNRICVRPDHLFLGTRADNNADMIRKGRQRSGQTVKTAARGEAQGLAKLKTADVLEIRRLCVNRTMTFEKMAALFGVDRSVIWNILKGKTWRHVL